MMGQAIWPESVICVIDDNPSLSWRKRHFAAIARGHVECAESAGIAVRRRGRLQSCSGFNIHRVSQAIVEMQ